MNMQQTVLELCAGDQDAANLIMSFWDFAEV